MLVLRACRMSELSELDSNDTLLTDFIYLDIEAVKVRPEQESSLLC